MEVHKLVLIADDFDDSAALVADLVAHETHFDTRSAKDGAEALAIADERTPDVAVLDVDMPNVTGLEAAAELRVRFGIQRPYIIALTGREDTDYLRSTLMFDEVLSKPVSLEDLVSRIRAAVAP